MERRQHAIGNYIPDFVCIEKKLIIELDGSQHLEQEEYDKERTKYLESLGYKVIRFWNNNVTNRIDSVLTVILDLINDENKQGADGGVGESIVRAVKFEQDGIGAGRGS